MINVTRASKWMDSISQADFEEILSKFEKGNPAAIELFDIMCQKGCVDYGSYTDTIAVTKRIFDYKWFDSMAKSLEKPLLGNSPVSSIAQNALDALVYIASNGHVPAMYMCGEHYRILALGTDEYSNIETAIDWYQRAGAADYCKAIKRLKNVRSLFYHIVPRARRLPTKTRLDFWLADAQSFEAKADYYADRIPALAAIIS